MYEDRTLLVHLRGKDPELKVYQEPLQPVQKTCDFKEDVITCGAPFVISVRDQKYANDMGHQNPKTKCLNCKGKVLKANDVKIAKKAKDEEAEKMKKAEEKSTELKEEQELNRLRRENLDLLTAAREATE